MVATPGDGSCGIGTYARDLLAGIRDGTVAGGIDPGGPGDDGPIGTETAADRTGAVSDTTVTIPQDDRSFRRFVGLAVRAGRAAGDVVHVQHEYGLFRRDDSRYPGVMGLVFFPLLFALARVRSRPVVVTMHSVLKPTPDEAPLRVRLYLILQHKLLAVGAAHLVFLAPDCAETFRADIDLEPDDYSVLPHGVNADVPVHSTAAARRRFGFDPDDRVVAIPGFMRPPKGHDVFVEVARRLPEYEFLIAGGARPKGADFAFAEEITETAPPNVTVTGVLDDADYWLALAAPDLALLPYRVVTQSGTFNSCATQELPVLASDADYFSRIERTWGAPETVDVADVDAVVDRVRALLEDDERRRRLADVMRGYKRANSFEQVGASHRRIYRRVRTGAATGPDATDRHGNGPAEPAGPARAACSAQRPLPGD